MPLMSWNVNAIQIPMISLVAKHRAYTPCIDINFLVNACLVGFPLVACKLVAGLYLGLHAHLVLPVVTMVLGVAVKSKYFTKIVLLGFIDMSYTNRT